jgi:hypothetical protein
MELSLSGCIEITNSRISPLRLYSFQIRTDSRLANTYLLGDIHLRPALEIQISHMFAAFIDC